MTEPPLNLDRGFTVSVYFPSGSDPYWVSDFLSRVAEDAYSMPSDTLDAFVVGHAGDVLGIDGDEALAAEKARQEHYEESVVGALNERNTRDCRRADTAEAQVARIRAFLEDMAGWCSPHGVAADYAQRGLDALDSVDPLQVNESVAVQDMRGLVRLG